MQLKYVNRQVRKEIQAIYEASFPENERVSFSHLLKQARHRNAYFYYALHHHKKVGLIYLIEYQDIVFIFYLAIKEEYRGRGLGSQILKTVLNHYPYHRIILNIEAGDDEEQVKRRAFYLKNGFELADYQTIENKVIYQMLYFQGYVSKKEYFEMVIDYFGQDVFNQYYVTGEDEDE